MDPEPYQRKAAELVSEDEAWREGLEDGAATPLLDWALRCVDDCLARAAAAADAAPEHLDDLAYAAADQARGLLAAIAALCRDEEETQGWEQAEPLLGPPLFADLEEGRAAAKEALDTARGTREAR